MSRSVAEAEIKRSSESLEQWLGEDNFVKITLDRLDRSGPWRAVICDITSSDELAESGGGSLLAALDELRQAAIELELVEAVECKFCAEPTPASVAHRHDGGFVGECCWDERLRATE